MLHTKPLSKPNPIFIAGVFLTATLLAACAQQQQHPDDYYSPKKEGTLTDAQRHAQGKRGAQAPSQLQFGFGEQTLEQPAQHINPNAESAIEAQAPSRQQLRSKAGPLLHPGTFLGTLPCTLGTSDCAAMRITLTTAPTGEWRSRREPISPEGNTHAPLIDQGCWDITGEHPLRIMLESPSNYASFVFVNNNMIKLTAFNGTTPQLSYHLTRQANVDPIEELDAPTMQCN